MKRQSFAADIADLDFSMLVPDGFVQPPIPAGITDSIDLDSPTESLPLALVASPVAAAFVTVAARPAYADGTVEQWLGYLAEHFGVALGEVQVARIGDAHDGIAAQGHQIQDGTQMILFLVAFEDGGRLVTGHGLAPAVLWPSFGEQLVRSVLSIRLDRPRGGSGHVRATATTGPLA